MPFQLPELPFAKDALAPVMSAETLEFHHGKHHKAYVTKTNELVEADDSLAGASLLQLVKRAEGIRQPEAVQQQRAVVEPQLLLAVPRPLPRPEAGRQARQADRGRVRQPPSAP